MPAGSVHCKVVVTVIRRLRSTNSILLGLREVVVVVRPGRGQHPDATCAQPGTQRQIDVPRHYKYAGSIPPSHKYSDLRSEYGTGHAGPFTADRF